MSEWSFTSHKESKTNQFASFIKLFIFDGYGMSVGENYGFTQAGREPCFDALHLSCPTTLQRRLTVQGRGSINSTSYSSHRWRAQQGIQIDEDWYITYRTSTTQSNVMPQCTDQTSCVIFAFQTLPLCACILCLQVKVSVWIVNTIYKLIHNAMQKN